MKKNGLLLALLFTVNALFAQKTMDAEAIARQHLSQNAKTWQLTDADISDVGVQYSYTTDDNGLTHVYLTQQRNGIEVFNAIVNVNVTKEGAVIYAGNRFISNLKVNVSQPVITAGAAITAIAKSLGMSVAKDPQPIAVDAKKRATFAPNGLAFQEMHAQLRYQPMGNEGKARLAWDVDMDAVNGHDHWNIRVDALTGEILDKTSWTVHCQFGDDHDHNVVNTLQPNAGFKPALGLGATPNTPLSNFSFFDKKQDVEALKVSANPLTINESARKTAVETLMLDDGKYNVLAIPTESPLHGLFSLKQNAVDTVASPYGWHDTTGTVGADLQITRGNNVHAFLDLKNYNRSVGDEPNGGALLNFNFSYDALQTQSPTVRNLATTNLFYMNNILHDFTYRYGFNEAAGNFQYNNYGKGGLGRDFVNANAQDGSSLPDPALNNANMSTPPDGINGRMQMYLWARRGARMLTITAPSSVAGTFITGTAQIGQRVSTTPLSGEIVVFNDGNANPTEACSRSLANLTGKIALIDRGNIMSNQCSYGKKILNAQDSGAIACIICSPTTALPNGINDTLTMVNINGVNRAVSSITIPVVTLTLTDCARLKAAAGAQATIQRAAVDAVGPDFVDGDFDNGIVAHEFGHGLSTRLTGGPANSSCLNGGEQMGEGWSDFLGLVLTAKTGDNGAMKRGIGNFAVRLPIDGNGIRRYPYSTDMTINPHTYDNLFVPNGQASPHPIGEIWCTTLWDMYWKFTDKYGFDQNVYNTKSGNGKAVKLVVDGMKIQPCAPGMLDGRDAIIAADKVNNNGDNVCMIWEAFARRGMGYSATQGKGTSASDNVEAFDMPPSCIKTVKIVKNMTPSVLAGQSVEVRLKIYNNRDTFAAVTLTDTVPQGATYVANSSNRTVSLAGVNILNFASFNIQPRDSIIIVYRIKTDPAKKSTLQFYDDMETSPNNWTTTTTGTSGWVVSDAYAKTGLGSFFADGFQISTERILRLTTPRAVSGQQPMLRFFHKFDTEGGFDAGVVEISTTNGGSWENAAPYTFRNPAFGRTYGTFAFADKTYWGNSIDFVPSYLDLSSFAGRNITIRYRLRTDVSTNSVGWAIDDVLMMDAVNYNAGVRMTASSGTTYRDTVRTIATQRGTIIEPEVRVSNEEINKLNVLIFPNPAQNVVNVILDNSTVASSLAITEAKASVLAIDGRVLMTQNVVGNAQINVANLAAGLYFIKVETDKGVFQKKIVKQ